MYFSFALLIPPPFIFSFFFFNDTATTEIYTLSLHDALPISRRARASRWWWRRRARRRARSDRSEEHTSELQSPCNLVCRLLLEKKKKHIANGIATTEWLVETPRHATILSQVLRRAHMTLASV